MKVTSVEYVWISQRCTSGSTSGQIDSHHLHLWGHIGAFPASISAVPSSVWPKMAFFFHPWAACFPVDRL